MSDYTRFGPYDDGTILEIQYSKRGFSINLFENIQLKTTDIQIVLVITFIFSILYLLQLEGANFEFPFLRELIIINLIYIILRGLMNYKIYKSKENNQKVIWDREFAFPNYTDRSENGSRKNHYEIGKLSFFLPFNDYNDEVILDDYQELGQYDERILEIIKDENQKLIPVNFTEYRLIPLLPESFNSYLIKNTGHYSRLDSILMAIKMNLERIEFNEKYYLTSHGLIFPKMDYVKYLKFIRNR